MNEPVSGGAAHPSTTTDAVIAIALPISRAPTRSWRTRTPSTSNTIRPSPSAGCTIATDASESAIACSGHATRPQTVPSTQSRRRTSVSSSDARSASCAEVRRASSACSEVESAYIADVSPPSRIATKTRICGDYDRAMVGISLLTLVPGELGGSETYVRGLLRGLGRVGTQQYKVLLPPGSADRVRGAAGGDRDRVPARAHDPAAARCDGRRGGAAGAAARAARGRSGRALPADDPHAAPSRSRAW